MVRMNDDVMVTTEAVKNERATMGTVSPSSPVFLTVDEVAAVLRCSARSVYRLVDSGRMLPPCRFGRLLRWHGAAFDAWVANGCPASRPSRR